nr:MAG TPA: hypothetical protein [Bacteriophage sp.]
MDVREIIFLVTFQYKEKIGKLNSKQEENSTFIFDKIQNMVLNF